MKLPTLAISHHQFTLVVTLLLVLLGAASFQTMPRSEDPLFDIPLVVVGAVYPGASPADVEQLVLDPIEEELGELEDVKKVVSSVQDGYAEVHITFLSGVDPEEKLREVSRVLDAVRAELPAEVTHLRRHVASSTRVSILQVALTSATAPYATLQRAAEDLERRLERIGGVKQADTWGHPEREVRVEADLAQLRAAGLSLDQLAGGLAERGTRAPGGSVEVGRRHLNVRSSGGYTDLEQLRQTVVAARGDHLVRLADVASVRYAYEEHRHRTRFNGERAVFVTAAQRANTNIFQVMEGLQAEVEAFREALPVGVELHVVMDQSEAVAHRLDGFFVNLLQGLAVVGLVVLLALGLRASAIVMITIPISLVIALAWLDLSGYGLQQISIVGMVIALGLLVDNAIVVTENVHLSLARGLDRRRAAAEGAGRVGWAITSGTATTVMALIPLVALRSDAGDFVRSLPVMVIYGLLASLLISLTFTPLLCSRFLRHEPGASAGASRDGAHDAPRRRFPRLVQRLADGPYRRLLAFAMRRPFVVLGAALLLFIGSLQLFPYVGVSLFPKAEKPQFLVRIDTPGGTNLEATDAAAAYVEEVLAAHPDVQHYATNVGRGNPQVYYNVGPKESSTTHAELLVTLGVTTPEAMAEALQGLRAELSAYPHADILLLEFQQGPPLAAPVEVKVLGEDLTQLRALAAEVEQVMRQTPGARNVDNAVGKAKIDLRMDLDYEKAGLLGVRPAQVDRTVRALLTGLPVARFHADDGETMDVVLGVPEAEAPALDAVQAATVPTVAGAHVPIRQVAALAFESGPLQFEHFNHERSAPVTAFVEDAYTVAEVTDQIVQQLDAMDWPPGYRYYVAGEAEGREESFGGIGQVLILAVLGIFAILVLQFRSFAQPFIIFSSVPFALTGALVGLWLTGYTFSFMAAVGLVSLVGIVVNDAILLVDTANEGVAAGQSVAEAVIDAGRLRLLPVLVTSLTTIGGLLPLTLGGGSLWAPFGWTIIGGLVASTLLILVVVPTLFRVLTRPTPSAHPTPAAV